MQPEEGSRPYLTDAGRPVVAVIVDGMADRAGFAFPPMPALEEMRSEGCSVMVQTIPDGRRPSSDVAILTLLGYDLSGHQGRAALEALGAGAEPADGEVAVRCDTPPGIVLRDEPWFPSSGRIVRGDTATGHNIVLLPAGEAERLRIAAPAGVRIWGESTRQRLDPLPGGGVMVCGVALLRGIGLACGMEVVTPTGATGDCSTDYAAKARAAIDAARRHDFVVVHIEACDTAAHMRSASLKRRALADIDSLVIAPLLDYARRTATTLIVTPDHPTYCDDGTHGSDPVTMTVWPCGRFWFCGQASACRIAPACRQLQAVNPILH